MDITKMNLTELKALAFDILVRIESEQNNLKIINQQIAKLSQEEKAAPTQTAESAV